MLGAVTILKFLMANESVEVSFFTEEDQPGRIIKLMYNTLKTECILNCVGLNSFALFNEKDDSSEGTCSCVERMTNSQSTFSVSKPVSDAQG